jgi:creatinine amidohydrolase
VATEVDARFLWACRTYAEVRDAIASGKLIALLPIGATEAHGPHLALDADVVIAEEVALRAARALERDGLAPLILPPIAYAVTSFAGEFQGTVGIGEHAARHVLDDLFTSLAAQGVRALAIVNHHLEPAHLAVLREAAVNAPKRLRIAFADQTRKPHALALGDEFRSGDCHAGRYETSLLLACAPARVREETRRELEPRWLGLVAAMRAGKRTFGEIGADTAYFGDPRAATAEEGERLLAALADMVVASAKEITHGS